MKRLFPLLLLCAAAPGLRAQAPAALQGGGVEVSLDLHGFKQDDGLKNFNGSYFRLGTFSTTPEEDKALGHHLIVSVLIDDAPDNVKGNAFLLGFGATKNAMAAMAGPEALPGATLSMQRLESPQGMLLWYTQQHSVDGKQLCQFNVYFETLMAGKWTELHFSTASAAPLDDTTAVLSRAKAIAASLKAQPIPSPAAK